MNIFSTPPRPAWNELYPWVLFGAAPWVVPTIAIARRFRFLAGRSPTENGGAGGSRA